MTINEYQELAMTTLNPELSKREILINSVMGLCGESGEVIDIVKKWMAQGHELDKELPKLLDRLRDDSEGRRGRDFRKACVGKSVKVCKSFQPPLRQQLMAEWCEMDTVRSEHFCAVLFFRFLHSFLKRQERELILAGESFNGIFNFPDFREPV